MTPEHFHSLAHVLPEAMVLVAGDGTILALNRAAVRLLGVGEEALVGRSILDLATTKREQTKAYLRNCSATGQLIPWQLKLAVGGGEECAFRCEGAAVRPRSDDAPATILLRLKPKESAVNRFTLLNSKIDELAKQVTVRKRAELALKASVERFRLLAKVSKALASTLDYEATLETIARLVVPALGDFCFFDILDREDRLQRVSWAHADPAWANRFEEIPNYLPVPGNVDHPVVKAIHDGRTVLVPEVTEDWMRKVAVSPAHARFMRDLEVRSVVTVVLATRGRRLGALTVGRTVGRSAFTATDAELIEEVAARIALALQNVILYRESQEASRLKDEFLATVSHELRTPLNAILGWSRMMSTGRLDDDSQHRAVEVIERNARAQAQLIEDLLDVSRIITGRLRLNLRVVDLVAVIEEAVDALRPAAANRNIRLQLILEPTAEPVSGDPERLQQVVWNLVSNAIKFTPKGGRVQVRLVRVNSHVEITVSDTGEGIDPGFLPFVFDRFRQADSTTTRHHGGLGLGLAIVRHLVELHGGSVQCHSEGVGHGATFTITLPLMIVRDPDRFLDDAAIQSHPVAFDPEYIDSLVRLGGLEVLLVDDDPDALDLLTTILESFGAQVRAARTVDEAVESCAELPPDLLISDIEMPGEDGYSLIDRVRSLPIGDMPAIALTAHARTEDRLRVLASGFDSHVAKPFEPAELVTVIGSLARRIGLLKDGIAGGEEGVS